MAFLVQLEERGLAIILQKIAKDAKKKNRLLSYRVLVLNRVFAFFAAFCSILSLLSSGRITEDREGRKGKESAAELQSVSVESSLRVLLLIKQKWEFTGLFMILRLTRSLNQLGAFGDDELPIEADADDAQKFGEHLQQASKNCQGDSSSVRKPRNQA